VVNPALIHVVPYPFWHHRCGYRLWTTYQSLGYFIIASKEATLHLHQYQGNRQTQFGLPVIRQQLSASGQPAWMQRRSSCSALAELPVQGQGPKSAEDSYHPLPSQSRQKGSARLGQLVPELVQQFDSTVAELHHPRQVE
jgi:hypothetical protein